jgi:hypothetical protein
MNLGRHIDLLWRNKAVAAGGVLLGLILALLSIYQLPSMERRGSEQWSVESNILVTQPGFPEGRVTLPDTTTGVQGAVPEGTAESDSRSSQKFADPNRLSSLALLYSVIADSDQVRQKLQGGVARGQIEAVALDATGNGTTFLPIIQLVTKAASAPEAQSLNSETFKAFKALLESQQKANDIAPSGRIRLNLLNAPSEPRLLSGPSMTPAVLAFLLCMLATLAVIHLREGLSLRGTGSRAEGGFGPTPPDAPMLEPVELAPLGTARRRTG